MGCNCGKKADNTRYVLTDASGKSYEYRTQTEAQMAAARLGGGSIKTVTK